MNLLNLLIAQSQPRLRWCPGELRRHRTLPWL